MKHSLLNAQRSTKRVRQERPICRGEPVQIKTSYKDGIRPAPTGDTVSNAPDWDTVHLDKMAGLLGGRQAYLHLSRGVTFVYYKGSIPSLYREIYEVLCPDGSTKIPQAICIRALSKSGLPKAILSEV